nr:Lantibiotic dehydratase domain protein [uncultured bacterium]
MHITLPTGARVDGSFVVRTAGLPANTLRQLRFEESFALVERLAGDRAWLRAEGNALADELHAVIGTAAEADKPALVGLRRALHRVRRPSGREWNPQIVVGLPAELVDRVREWIVTLRTAQQVATALPGVLAAELAEKDLELRAVATRPQFRRALAHASPALSGELSKWLSGRRRPRRQSLIRLAKYVARAVAKTSPLSTFTVSGLGTWSEDNVREKPDPAVVGVTELDGALLHLLTRGLRNDPELSAAMPLRVNPSVTLHDDRVMFVGTTAREPVVSVAARLGELHRAVGELAGLAGLDSPQTREHYQFRDNAVYRGTVAVEPISRWRTALSDLDTVRRWMGAFDVGLPWRLALGTYCGERFGPGSEVPFLLLHRAIHEERTRNEGAERTLAAEAVASMVGNALVMLPSELVESRVPRLRELAAIRRQAGAAMRDHAPDDGVVRVGGGAVADLVAHWPEWVTPPGSLGCCVQIIPDGDVVRLVLNVAQTGYGRGRSHVRQIITQAGEVAPPDESWLSPGGEPVLAEVRGAFASSANRRPPSLPYEIDYPGVVSDRPASERIRLGELVVVHDPRTDLVRLVWKRKGVQVRPVHLGMMSDVMLPPAARLLTYTFGAAHYLHTTALSMLSPIVEPLAERQVVARPRVEVGRVVLQRARWVARQDTVPRRDKGETDGDYWVRMTGWLHANGIPLKCFVQMRPDEGPRAGNPFAWAFSRSRKPVYIDFANWYLVAVFERMLAGARDVVVFAEALPEPGGAESHVTEYLVELSEPEHRDAG